MRVISNIVLLIIVLGLGYLLYFTIEEPIRFNQFYESRTDNVIDKLRQIREAQEYYKDINGEYAKTFDELSNSLKNDSFPIVKVYETEETDLTGEYAYDTTYIAAADSLHDFTWYENIDDLKYVPNSDNKTFEMHADTLTYEQALTNIIEVKTTYGTFMGDYADTKYQKYNKNYSPSNVIKFGDLTKPTTSGNWR